MCYVVFCRIISRTTTQPQLLALDRIPSKHQFLKNPVPVVVENWVNPITLGMSLVYSMCAIITRSWMLTVHFRRCPAFIWWFVLEKNSAGCLIKTKRLMKICIVRGFLWETHKFSRKSRSKTLCRFDKTGNAALPALSRNNWKLFCYYPRQPSHEQNSAKMNKFST